MISIDVLVTQVSGLQRRDIDFWISQQWVRPDGHAGNYLFQDVDVARVRLIQELRDVMLVNEEALPVVLSLLDQLYDQRRRMRELCDAVSRISSDEMRQKLIRFLSAQSL